MVVEKKRRGIETKVRLADLVVYVEVLGWGPKLEAAPLADLGNGAQPHCLISGQVYCQHHDRSS